MVAVNFSAAQNGYFYVGMNGPLQGDNKKCQVLRYTIDRKPPHRIMAGSQKVIIEWVSNGHNGADLAFGRDGMLYVSSGDGTSDSDTNLAGQDLTHLLSKVLRIDVDHPDPGKNYSVPKDNPFVGQKGIRPETWAYGFRNPWRLHIDPKSGDLWVGLFAVRGTPPEITAKLASSVNQALGDKELRDKLEAQGAQVLTGTPQEFAAQLKQDIERWSGIVKASGATVD